MIGIIIGNSHIETPKSDDIPSLIDRALIVIKNEPLECPTGYYKVFFAEGYEPAGDEWSRDPDGSYVMCGKYEPFYVPLHPNSSINESKFRVVIR